LVKYSLVLPEAT